ncbi:MAG: hypothetical protein KIH08_11860 [Candidatus Freyarchaeota archaeon]|nr:hypothetical protein [Candidatus Jordarchaeia archaeon]MBS7269327.1 hypothetical protein [Candidatus Jordarchaeia archaeon]MBS7281133.1 hypothetical protein [Candidatus Jordarchaeia archaeon]
MDQNVIFAHADYQEDVETTEPVKPRIRDTLKTEAFPAYPKMDFPSLKDYSGIKVFPIEDFAAISYFLNERRRDSSGRPVLSARVALIPQKFFNTWGRDLDAVKTFLKSLKIETASNQSFLDFVREKSAIFNREELVRLINSFGGEYVAKAIDCIMSHHKVNIYYGDKGLAESLVRSVYLLLPISIIMSKSYSSECSYISGSQRENYVLTPGGDVRGGDRGGKEIGFLDVDSGKASSGKYFKKLKILIEEIVRGKEWYTLTWEEECLLLLELPEAWFSGRKIKMTEASNKLQKMEETLNAVRMLEKV